MIRILIEEDETAISSMVALSLRKHGYFCECVSDGEVAADRIEDGQYDLILLDVMLPGLSGFELMEMIRPHGIPVIFLTARDAVNDRVKGLQMGAEDYMVKPFAVTELLARVEVVLRRYNKGDGVITIGNLRIDTRSRQVWEDEKSLLSPKKSLNFCCYLPAIQTPLYTAKRFMNKYGAESWNLAVKQLI